MTGGVTITDIRNWMTIKFSKDYIYMPHMICLPWATIHELNLHRRYHYFVLKEHAPKALLVGHDKSEMSSSIWAVLNTCRQEIHYYKVPKDGSATPWSFSKSSPLIAFAKPLGVDKISSEALLIYYFLEFRAVQAWKVDERFFNDLEKAFLQHMTTEREIHQTSKERRNHPTITLNYLKSTLETCFGLDFRYICQFIQVIRMGNAILIGNTIGTDKLPVYAFPSRCRSTKISYCVMSGMERLRLEHNGHNIEQVQLMKPFSNVYHHAVSPIAMKRLKALVLYLSLTLSGTDYDQELQTYEEFQQDLKAGIRNIMETTGSRAGHTSRDQRNYVVPARMFREDLPNEERFTPFRPTIKFAAPAIIDDDENDAKPVVTGATATKNLPECTSAKRGREDEDQKSYGQRPEKRLEPSLEQSNYQKMHEKLTVEYSDMFNLCNKLQNEKIILEKRISELSAAVVCTEELIAKSKEWEMKFEIANRTLNNEVNKAKENAQKIKEEDEAEAALLEKQGQAMLEAAAKKRAKHASI